MANEIAVKNFYNQSTNKHTGILSWLLTKDHKRIGLMYMVAILTFFVVGMLIGILMRLELIAPGRTIMSAQTYNSFFTLHGVIMIFLFIIPWLLFNSDGNKFYNNSS